MELMVGMTLGLVGLLIVTQVLSVNNTIQARISAAGESQSVGNLSLYTMERDVKQAGYGFASTTLLGCTLTGTDNTRGIPLVVGNLVPVTIAAGASTNLSDQLTVAYGTSQLRMSSVFLAAGYDGGVGILALSNAFGFQPGDYFLLGQAGNPKCVLGQVSSLVTTVTGPLQCTTTTPCLAHANTGIYGRYNNGAGEGVAYNANVGELYDLGSGFNYVTYRVVYCASASYAAASCQQTPDAAHGASLLIQESFLTGNVLVIAENVQTFQAQYGHDSDADGTVDTWDTVQPTSAAGWAATPVIRMGLALKESTREPAQVTASPLSVWLNGPAVILSEEDQHYRYKTYSVTVPLRNMIWRTFL